MAESKSLKRYLLKKVLYRIDFQLITEKMQEEMFAFIGQEYGQYFADQYQEMENAIGIEINPNQVERSRLNQKAQPVYVFSQQHTEGCDGRVLKIGKTFLFLQVELNIEPMQIPYYEWMAHIVNKWQENPMFRLSRIGLRKYNSFYILDENKDKLAEMFNVDYLSQVDSSDFQLGSFEHMQTYSHEPYTMNFHRSYSTGNLSNPTYKIDNKIAHLVSFDFDLATDDLDEMASFAKDAKKGLEIMNKWIYDFFVNTMKKEVIEKIADETLLESYHIIPF